MALTSGFVGVSTSSAANPIALARIRAESVGYFKKYTFQKYCRYHLQYFHQTKPPSVTKGVAVQLKRAESKDAIRQKTMDNTFELKHDLKGGRFVRQKKASTRFEITRLRVLSGFTPKPTFFAKIRNSHLSRGPIGFLTKTPNGQAWCRE